MQRWQDAPSPPVDRTFHSQDVRCGGAATATEPLGSVLSYTQSSPEDLSVGLHFNPQSITRRVLRGFTDSALPVAMFTPPNRLCSILPHGANPSHSLDVKTICPVAASRRGFALRRPRPITLFTLFTTENGIRLRGLPLASPIVPNGYASGCLIARSTVDGGAIPQVTQKACQRTHIAGDRSRAIATPVQITRAIRAILPSSKVPSLDRERHKDRSYVGLHHCPPRSSSALHGFEPSSRRRADLHTLPAPSPAAGL